MNNKKYDFDKRLLIVLIVVIILFILLQLFNTSSKNKYDTMKEDETKKYVYTKYQSATNDSFVPHINLIGEDVNEVNKQIVTDASNYLTSKDINKTITYRYNQNANIVSVVIIYKEAVDKKLKYSFKTYVFDLKQNCKLLTDDEILKIYKLSTKDINNKLKELMQEKYKLEVKNDIIDGNECDYQCFLKLRGIDNYTDNANYYIENSRLVVYKSFDVYSKYKEEKYFTRDDFKFYMN